MAGTFSTYALEAAGFIDVIEKGSLSARFISVTVYEALGIFLPEGFAEMRQARVAEVDYQICLASSVNSGCQRLIGDDFTESEPEWRKEVKSTGPFVLVAVGPTESVECEAGRMMRMPDGSITTYNSFPSIRETLELVEDRVLPPVISALTIALNSPDHYVTLRKLARVSVGRTPEGTLIHDIRFDFYGEMTVSRHIGEQEAIEVLAATVERAPSLHQRAAKYFLLGTAEKDQLKKFLYFFLSLEVETHSVFGRIDHATAVHRQFLSDGTGNPPPSIFALMTRDISKWNNLFDRFVWCATCKWPNLVVDDITLFKTLKKARDDIAHGKASEPPSGFARQAELLAHKVLWLQTGNDA